MKKTNIATLLIAVLLLVTLAGCTGTPGGSSAPASASASTSASPIASSSSASAPAGTQAAGGYAVKFDPFVSYTGLGTALGIQKGIFKDAGLNLDINNITDKVSGLVSGDIDFADLNTSQAITATAKGAPFKIVGSMFRTKGAFYLIASNNIKTIADLKGKKIGNGQAGSGLDAYTRVILQKNNLDPDKDVTLIANGVYQQALASLQSGQVDATIIHQPYVELAQEQGIGHLLAKGYEYLPTFHTGVLVASDKFIKDHPDDLKKIIKAYYDSWTYAKNHIDETLDFGATYINTDRATLQKALESELPLWTISPAVDISAINDTQDVQIQLGFQ